MIGVPFFNDSDPCGERRPDRLRTETITGEGLSAPTSLAFNQNQKLLYGANLSGRVCCRFSWQSPSP